MSEIIFPEQLPPALEIARWVGRLGIVKFAVNESPSLTQAAYRDGEMVLWDLAGAVSDARAATDAEDFEEAVVYSLATWVPGGPFHGQKGLSLLADVLAEPTRTDNQNERMLQVGRVAAKVALQRVELIQDNDVQVGALAALGYLRGDIASRWDRRVYEQADEIERYKALCRYRPRTMEVQFVVPDRRVSMNRYKALSMLGEQDIEGLGFSNRYDAWWAELKLDLQSFDEDLLIPNFT